MTTRLGEDARRLIQELTLVETLRSHHAIREGDQYPPSEVSVGGVAGAPEFVGAEYGHGERRERKRILVLALRGDLILPSHALELRGVVKVFRVDVAADVRHP